MAVVQGVPTANFVQANNNAIAMQNATSQGQQANPYNGNGATGAPGTGTGVVTLPASPSGGTATTTPIIGATAATNDYNTKLGATQALASGVQNQAQTVAQNQANNAANTTQPTSTQSGGNQPSGGQNGASTGQNGQVSTQTNSTQPVDNSDLTSALTGATAALNAGNGITPPDQNALNNTESQFNTEAGQINDQLNTINSDLSTGLTAYQNQISQIQNGTIPLNPNQQALLNQTNSAVQSLVQSAQTQAQLYAQVGQSLGARTGLEQFSPAQALQNINSAAAKGAAAIADAQFKGVQALADLQKNFQDEDLTAINDSYDALTKNLDQQQASLEKMATDVQTAAKDAQDEYNTQMNQYITQTQNAISNAFKADTLDETQKQDLFNNALKTSQFNETQKQNIIDDYYKGVSASQNATKIQQGQENIDLKVQALQQSQNTATQAAGNAVITLPNKAQYIDGTNLDAAGKAAALNAGVPVLSGDNAKSMTTINNIQTQFGGLLSSLQQAGVLNDKGQFTITNDPATGITNKGGTNGFLHYWAGGSAEPSIVNFGTNVKSMISDLQKLPGTGDLVQSLEDNTPLKTDNAQQLQTKFSNLTNDLLSSQNDLLGGGLDTATQEGATGVINGKTYTFTNGNWVSQ